MRGHTFKYVIFIQDKNSQDVKFFAARIVWKKIRAVTNKMKPVVLMIARPIHISRAVKSHVTCLCASTFSIMYFAPREIAKTI